jgi:hypothetical protein
MFINREDLHKQKVKIMDENETRSLTMPKETWQKLDTTAKKRCAINAQEVIRQWINENLEK